MTTRDLWSTNQPKWAVLMKVAVRIQRVKKIILHESKLHNYLCTIYVRRRQIKAELLYYFKFRGAQEMGCYRFYYIRCL
jgi:hypothetical protein